MKSEFIIKKRNSYLYFTIIGKYDREEFKIYASLIIDACEKEKIYRVLIDALNVIGADLSIMERFIIGEKVAKLFPPTFKMAVAWPQQYINRFAETVAVNRGGFLRVMGDVEAAEKWLLTPV